MSVAAASPLKARRLGCIGFREGKKECFEGLSPLKPFKWRVRQARHLTGLSGGQEGMRRGLPPKAYQMACPSGLSLDRA